MLKKYLFISFSVLPALTFAKVSAPKDLKYTISPIVGYETVFRVYPKPHSLTHVIYGARLTAGIDVISAEAEYTKGTDTENYTVAPEEIKTNEEKLKLGVRSTYRFNELLFVTGRFGGQATKTTRQETSAGVTTSTDEPIKYDPYAGAHVGISLGPVSVAIGATAIIRDVNDMTKNDVQHTLSVTLGN